MVEGIRRHAAKIAAQGEKWSARSFRAFVFFLGRKAAYTTRSGHKDIGDMRAWKRMANHIVQRLMDTVWSQGALDSGRQSIGAGKCLLRALCGFQCTWSESHPSCSCLRNKNPLVYVRGVVGPDANHRREMVSRYCGSLGYWNIKSALGTTSQQVFRIPSR